MKKFSAKALALSRYPVAIVAGLLLALSFPKSSVAGLAWVAPGLILTAALGRTGRQRFWIGFVAGFSHSLAALYWLLLIPVTGFPILGWIVLSAYCALFPATWVALTFGVARSPGGENRTWLEGAREISSWSWARRMRWAFSSAAIWVALEMVLARLFTGFPWDLLGVSQYQNVPLIQIASFTGVYGISFLLVWTSVSFLCSIVSILARPTVRYVWMREMILPCVAIVASLAFGFHQLLQRQPVSPGLRVTLIQPSIPQTMIWNPDNDMARFNELVRLSEQALTNETDLLIWPEAAVPKLLRYDADIFQAVTNLARRHRVWMIVGSDDAEPKPGSKDPKEAVYYNASFLVSPEGKLVDRYKKWGLVIFGEYIPLEHSLPFMKWFTPVTGSYTRGDKPVAFQMVVERRRSARREDDRDPNSAGSEAGAPEPLRVKTSVLICFEDIFPHLVRRYPEPDTDFLVNITNNGWFGDSAAQWQHAATAIFRAIENGLPLVRCANNGLTCWVDRYGLVRHVFRDRNGTIYGPGVMTVEIPLLPPGETRQRTFYSRHGDWFGWGCVGVAGAGVIAGLLLRRRKGIANC